MGAEPRKEALHPEARAAVAALVARARKAQAAYERRSQAELDEAATAAGWAIMKPENNRALAELAVRDTGLGNVADKIAKNHRKTLGLLRDIQGVRTTGVIAEYPERGLTEIARAVGVVAAITPSTNPGATPANKIINALKCGNAVIVAPSPKGHSTCAMLLGFIYKEFEKIHADPDLVQVLPAPVTKEATHELMRQCDLVAATGSQSNIRAAYSSGKPAIGVGQGNVVSIVDEEGTRWISESEISRVEAARATGPSRRHRYHVGMPDALPAFPTEAASLRLPGPAGALGRVGRRAACAQRGVRQHRRRPALRRRGVRPGRVRRGPATSAAHAAGHRALRHVGCFQATQHYRPRERLPAAATAANTAPAARARGAAREHAQRPGRAPARPSPADPDAARGARDRAALWQVSRLHAGRGGAARAELHRLAGPDDHARRRPRPPCARGARRPRPAGRGASLATGHAGLGQPGDGLTDAERECCRGRQSCYSTRCTGGGDPSMRSLARLDT